MSRVVRASKFRHVFGTASKRENSYDGLRITRNAWDRDFCAVNPKFLAIVLEAAGGGSFIVLPLEQTGRVAPAAPKVSGHKSAVMDIAWDPFDDNVIASASDDCTIKVWEIPEGGLTEDLTEPIVDLVGHERKVGEIQWHPVAKDILISSAFDWTIRVWNVATAEELNLIECHTDTIFTMSWNPDGSQICTASKDKLIRVIDPRSGKVLSEGQGHDGSKAQRACFVGKDKIFSTGFSKMSERQCAVWDSKKLENLATENIDSGAGVLFPYYDPDTHVVYVAGKGDGNIRYYEITDDKPYLHFLSEFKTKLPQRGLGFMPKRGVNPNECEVARFYKLQSTGLVEVINMTVPRKSDTFQDDLFPPTAAAEAALTAEQWWSGKNAQPKTVDMRTFFTGTVRASKPKAAKKKDDEEDLLGDDDLDSAPAPVVSPPPPKQSSTSRANLVEKAHDPAHADPVPESSESVVTATGAVFEPQKDVSDVKRMFSNSQDTPIARDSGSSSASTTTTTTATVRKTTSAAATPAVTSSAAPAATSSSSGSGPSKSQLTAINGKIAGIERLIKELTQQLAGLKEEVGKL